MANPPQKKGRTQNQQNQGTIQIPTTRKGKKLMFKNRRRTKRLMIEINVLAKAQMAVLDEIAAMAERAPHDQHGNLTKGTKTSHEINGLKRALTALQNVELQK